MLLVPLIVAVRHRAPSSPKPAGLGVGSSSPAVQAAFAAPPAAVPAATAYLRPGEIEPPASAAGAPEASATPPGQTVADPPLPPGFARLTVHSSTSTAMVYGKSKIYGLVEEELVVPCGRQFLRIGIPQSKAKRVTWLGRGKTIPIACGQAVEITMDAGAPR